MRPLVLPLILLLAPAPQEVPRVEPGEIFISTDREADRHLRRAREAVEGGEWETAVRLYDQILGHPRSGEALYAVGEGHYRSARSACRQQLLSLPPQGLAAYRDRVDPDARTALEEARRRQDPAAARLIAERYPASSIVPEALAWSAAFALDHGLYSDAAWAISRMLEGGHLWDEERVGLSVQLAICYLRSGDREGAIAVRERVMGTPGAEIRIGDTKEDAVGFLDRLLGSRGDGGGPDVPPVPAEVDAGGEGATWDLRWAHRISDYYQKGDREPAAFLYALGVGGDVLFHDGNHACCLELSTGRLRWKVRLHPGADSYRLPEGECRIAAGGGAVYASPRGEAMVALDRISGDLLWRRDAKEIREGLDLGFPVRLSASIAHYGGMILTAATSTHAEAEVLLIALDAETGEPLWSRFVASRPGVTDRGATLLHDGVRIYLLSDIGIAAALDLPQGTLRWVRARDESSRRPSALVSGTTLHLLFPGSDRRLEADPWSGDLRGDGPAAGVDELIGFLGEGICGGGRGGVVLLTDESKRPIWASAGGDRSSSSVSGERLFIPGATGIVRIERGGQAGPLVGWGGGTPGNLLAAGGIVLSAASDGVFAYAPRGEAAGPLPPDIPIADLVGHLEDPDWRVREAADRRLREMAPEAIPEIGEGKESRSAEVRWRTEEIVYAIDRRARMATWRERLPDLLLEKEPELLSQLTHRDPEIRRDGLYVLASEGGPEVAFLLRDLLGDRDAHIRMGAARMLLYLGDRSGFPIVEEGLGSESAEERRWALETLQEYGETGDASRIEPLLDDPDPRVRLAALRAYVSRLGSEAQETVREKLLDDPEDWIRLEVVRTAHEEWGRSAVDLMREGLEDESEAVRLEALLGLEGFFTEEVAEGIGAALLDESRTISIRAAEILHRQVQRGWGHRIRVDPLEEALRSDDENLRYAVVQILEKLRRRSAIPGLLVAVRDENPEIGKRALDALGGLARARRIPEGRVPEIGRLLDLESAEVRRRVVRLLSLTRSPAANESLIRALGDIDEEVAGLARRTLVARADSKTVVRLLAISLDEEAPARAEVNETLRLLPPGRLVPGLIDGLEDDRLAVRTEASRRLREATGAEMGYDPSAEDRREAVRRWRSWWHLRQNPGLSPASIVRDLKDPSPRVRHRGAVDAAKIQDEEVIRALIEGLQGEKVRWVLDKMVEALRSVTGREFGYDRKGSKESRKAAIARWVEWWKKGRP